MLNLKIVIPVEPRPNAEAPARLRGSPVKTPKTPEEVAVDLVKHTRLHELHLENVTARAKRANEKVTETRARKLRLEASKRAIAAEKLMRATTHVDATLKEREEQRVAQRERRARLLAAVLNARDERASARQARQQALAELEDKAEVRKRHTVLATQHKGKQAVEHAAAVAAAQKAKLADDRARADMLLQSKQEAATARREEKKATTPSTPPSARLDAWLHTEATANETKRLQLAKAMGGAIGRRAGHIDNITGRARLANERAAYVADLVKRHREVDLPGAIRHDLTVRLQAAEVNRALAQQAKTEAISTLAAGLRPTSAPADDHYIRWLGPEGGAGRVVAINEVTTPTTKMAVKPAVVFVIIDTVPPAPVPAALVARLSFVPKTLRATSVSRQVAASGRRQVLRAFKVARATHFGTVLVAEVRARAQSRAEVKASILSVREQHATRVAQEAISDTRARARAANMRVVVAAMRRSEERLRVLSAAIDAEEGRQQAQLRRLKRLSDRTAGRWAHVKKVATMVRRTTARAAAAATGARKASRCEAATLRKEACLQKRIDKARMLMELRPRTAPPSAECPLKLLFETSDEVPPRVHVKVDLSTVPLAAVTIARHDEKPILAGGLAPRSLEVAPANPTDTLPCAVESVRNRLATLASSVQHLEQMKRSLSVRIAAANSASELKARRKAAARTEAVRASFVRLAQAATVKASEAKLVGGAGNEADTDTTSDANALVVVGKKMAIQTAVVSEPSSEAESDEWQIVASE